MILCPVRYEAPLIKGTGKSSSLNPTNENGADRNNQHEKIENYWTIELTAFKLFVQEQFCITKKQLEKTKQPESTKQLRFSFFRSEIEYLSKQNRTKALINKQLTENKAMTFITGNHNTENKIRMTKKEDHYWKRYREQRN